MHRVLAINEISHLPAELTSSAPLQWIFSVMDTKSQMFQLSLLGSLQWLSTATDKVRTS